MTMKQLRFVDNVQGACHHMLAALADVSWFSYVAMKGLLDEMMPSVRQAFGDNISVKCMLNA